MATMLDECSTNKRQYFVARFCGPKGLNTKDIHKEIFLHGGK
jgi:hypothetical protein